MSILDAFRISPPDPVINTWAGEDIDSFTKQIEAVPEPTAVEAIDAQMTESLKVLRQRDAGCSIDIEGHQLHISALQSEQDTIRAEITRIERAQAELASTPAKSRKEEA